MKFLILLLLCQSAHSERMVREGTPSTQTSITVSSLTAQVSMGGSLVVVTSGTFGAGITASSGTFTATGSAQYSIAASSGISVAQGDIKAPNGCVILKNGTYCGNTVTGGDVTKAGANTFTNSAAITLASGAGFNGAQGSTFTIASSFGYAASTPTANSLYADNIPKAWIRFNGVNSTIQSSFNIAAMRKDGVGGYTVFFNVPFADTNYMWVSTCYLSTGGEALTMAGTTTVNVGNLVFRTYLGNSTQTDTDICGIVFYGKQ